MTKILTRLWLLVVCVALGALSVASVALAATDYRPVARENAYTVEEDTVLSVGAGPGVLTNDHDRNGDRLFAKLVRGTSNGEVVLNKNGSLMYDSKDDYAGPDSAAYVTCEYKHPRHCSSAAQVRFTVNGVNDAPVAENNFYTLFEGQSRTWNAPSVLGNDYDPEGGEVHVAGYTQPRRGLRVGLSPGGSLRMISGANAAGLYSYTYWSADEDGAKTPATVTVRVRNR